MYTGKIIHLLNDDGDNYSLSDNAIYSLYKDREGGMWIGSFFGGLNYYPKGYTYFEKFYPQGADGFKFGKGFANSAKEMMALFGSEQKIKDYLILIRQQAGFNLLLTPGYITMCTDFVSTAITCGWEPFRKDYTGFI